MAEDLQITKTEYQQIIDAFTSSVPGFLRMKTQLIAEWQQNKRIKLIDGRRIQVTREHKVLNYAIQGDAAILMKHWAMECERRLDGTSFRMLAVVHDEMQAECVPNDVKLVMDTLE